MVAFRGASWNFPCQDHDFKEFRGFPGMELGIFRAAKSSGEGRALRYAKYKPVRRALRSAIVSEDPGFDIDYKY